MKIKSITAFQINTKPSPKTAPRPSEPSKHARKMARPIFRYDRFKRDSNWTVPSSWNRPACIVEAEDGTWGFGISLNGTPVVNLINDHFAPVLVGEDCMAVDKLYDMMVRMSAPYGMGGLTSHAISAVDLALWDLKGKLLGKPVYELLGGPQKEKIYCYATGGDTAWYMELGFKAAKCFSAYGPEEGLDGIKKNEEMVARKREIVGPDRELMFDCWMSSDVETVVRLSETLKPYNLRWIEEYLLPDDWEGYAQVRERLPSQTLASGEHWYFTNSFASAAKRRLVDIFQPDVLWCGGISPAVKICAIAEATGIQVIPHASMNYPFGQHLAFAMPAVMWGERSEGVSPPGVPLEEMVQIPGTPVIKDSYLIPSDAPGFGMEIDQAWIDSVMT
ncbi:TPA: L-rhamnonate dehydratase [Candidatus Latescibacteria bacterium]|nr:L-rhamnonate dehydratase [Candidatus Latescibacterota bacterium]|tara:strand:+ start:1207 stop:2376 length:1170 start_codon:yes stop_codon:yes gene_type:complete